MTDHARPTQIINEKDGQTVSEDDREENLQQFPLDPPGLTQEKIETDILQDPPTQGDTDQGCQDIHECRDSELGRSIHMLMHPRFSGFTIFPC